MHDLLSHGNRLVAHHISRAPYVGSIFSRIMYAWYISHQTKGTIAQLVVLECTMPRLVGETNKNLSDQVYTYGPDLQFSQNKYFCCLSY